LADNTELNAGTGGDTIATDDIAGIKHQRVKVQHGADGSATDASAAAPLPVEVIDVTNTMVADVSTVAGAVNAEDAVHNSGDAGIMPLAVRSDTPSAKAADGDYTPFLTDEDGYLWTHGASHVVDANNSTTTPLVGDAVYTGIGTELLSYSSVSVFIDSSHDSVVDGMTFEFSTDNTNWDKVFIFTYTAADNARVFQLPTHAKYFRIVYTNGSTAQTAFRVQTILMHTTPSQTTHRLVDSIDPDRSVTAVKAAIVAQQAGTGDFIPIASTTGGNLKVAIEEADTSASGLAKAEDAPHSSSDVGVMALGVRTDTPTSRSGTDGDYNPLQTNDMGSLWVHHEPNDVNAGNSTIATLANGAIFTGTGVDVLEYSAVTIQLDSSHDSAVDGMSFEFSIDNTNWDLVHKFTYTAANGARTFQFPTHAQYFRLVYTNGGTTQTTFRVQTVLHHGTPITTIHRLVDSTDPDRSATIQKSVTIAQQAGTGDFIPVQATAGGNFKVSVEEFDASASLPAGTNNIGDVDIASHIPGTGATNLGKAQDSAGGATDTGIAMLAIRDDEQAVMTPSDGDYSTLRTDKFGNLKVTQLPDATSEVKYGVIDAALSGDNTLQAAAGAGIKIRILSVMMVSAGTVTARFESGAGGTALTGQMNLIANSGFTLPYNPAGWFETVDNTLLNLELSAAISVDGCFSYVEV